MVIKKISLILALLALTACGANPRNVNVELNESLPVAKTTTFNSAILGLGKMNAIYAAGPLNIMSKDIVDNTGTSIATSAEIPRDVTEMTKSTLNGIGGDITFIPYDPDFMINTANTGYSEWGDKILPDVLVSGGITEFDRGLVTKGDSLDFDTEGSMKGKAIGIEFGDQRKSSTASITLDFNLIDFKTFAGIPRMQAINNIKVNKAMGEDSLGFTIYGATFGAKGTIKKIQGRHESVRLLVQLSMIQIIGKYHKLPYWRLLPGGEADPVVTEQLVSDLYSMSTPARIVKLQEYLYLDGYPVNITGRIDNATRSALTQLRQKHRITATGDNIDPETFLAAYSDVPLDYNGIQRRKTVDQMIIAYQQQPNQVATTRPRAETRAKPAPQPARNGTLDIWTNKPQLGIGDKLEIGFEVDTPMYVRIVTVNSDGEVSTLFPNPYQSDNYCVPGRRYQIPPRSAKFALEVEGPAGTDRIRALASVNPVPADAMKLTAAGNFDEAGLDRNLAKAGVDITIH